MAGRGCTITIQLLQPNSVVENLELQVALHTPLSVLKEQLEVATGIRVDAQILILCDLNDPERNSDILLERLDATLMQCGIENGSVLTLHGLDNIDSSKPEHIESASKSLDSDCSNVYSIVSRIDAGKADHSYNGLIFDIEVLDAFEVELTDISVAGMLGHIRVYIRDKPWRIGRTPRSSMHWWAHEDTVSTEGWTCVVDKTHGASWDVPAKITFDEAVKLLPGSKVGVYIHSSLPDDLGIQYQSYTQGTDIVGLSEHLVIWPGLGHTSNIPFDDQEGWYRSWRGFCGAVGYKANLKGWTTAEHHKFPRKLKEQVKTLLLCYETAGSSKYTHVSPVAKSRKRLYSASNEDDTVRNSLSSEKPIFTVMKTLPRYVLYHIMEFMNWNWYVPPTSCHRSISSGIGQPGFSSNPIGEEITNKNTAEYNQLLHATSIDSNSNEDEYSGTKTYADYVDEFLDQHSIYDEATIQRQMEGRQFVDERDSDWSGIEDGEWSDDGFDDDVENSTIAYSRHTTMPTIIDQLARTNANVVEHGENLDSTEDMLRNQAEESILRDGFLRFLLRNHYAHYDLSNHHENAEEDPDDF